GHAVPRERTARTRSSGIRAPARPSLPGMGTKRRPRQCLAGDRSVATLMQVSLKPAVDSDIAFCEALSRGNMAHYHVARGIEWNTELFVSTWNELENHLLLADGEVAGLLRLLTVDDALDIRDLQVLP